MFHNRQWIQIDKSIFTVQIDLHQSSDEEVSWWHRTEPLNLAWLWAVGTCIYTDRKVVRYSMTVQIGTSTWNLRWMQRWTAEHRAAPPLAVSDSLQCTPWPRNVRPWDVGWKFETLRSLQGPIASMIGRCCETRMAFETGNTVEWWWSASAFISFSIHILFILLTFENRCRVCFYVHFWFPGSWVLGPVASPLMINFMTFPTSTVYVSAHLQTSLNGASAAKILGSAKLLKIPTCRTQPE